MADKLPTYGFLPWARQGLSVNISETDTLGTTNGTALQRATMNTKLDISYTDAGDAKQVASITKTVSVVGPGDVKGIHPSAVVRVQPKNGITNFEANGLAYVEFYEEDFCWRYTPAQATGSEKNSRLRPWLVLVALMEDEYTLVPNNAGLAYISIKPESFETCFHHQADNWAFAHVHINNQLEHFGGDDLKAEVNAEIGADPDMAVSRLLCPRKLLKNKHYNCFLIPAFETGRLAGLGIDPSAVPAQTPSWKKGAMPASDKRPFDFPVYYQWSFRTGNFGDFESLAMILKPFVMDKEQGKMPMDISDPGFNLQTVNNGSAVIGLEAALKPVDMISDKWPADGNVNDTATIDKLKTLLSLSADFVDTSQVLAAGKIFFSADLTDDPILVPPVYGVWHALVNKLDDPVNPPWVNELNLDYRKRAAAGFGTAVIQKRQEDFMHRAWLQVDRVNEANKKIEQAILAKQILRAIMKKNIVNAGKDKVFMLTQSVQSFVLNKQGTKTISKDFSDSRIPAASKSAAFRKLTRPNTRTASALKRFEGVTKRPLLVQQTSVLSQFNLDEAAPGAVRGAKIKTAALGAVNISSISNTFDQALLQYNADPKNLAVEKLVALLKTHVLENNTSQNKADLQNHTNALTIDASVKTVLTQLITNISVEPIVVGGNDFIQVKFNHAFFESFFGAGISKKLIDNIFLEDATAPAQATVNPIASSATLSELKSNFDIFSTSSSTLPIQKQLPAFTDIKATRSHLIKQLSPAATLASKILSTIKIFQKGVYVPLRKLVPVMAHPEFEEPVYNYLLELSKNYILPNIDKLPANSITILKNNQSFIESFMAGVNHEMSRELLWREYPTDQRGSYFRQFWNISDNVVIESSDTAAEKEIRLDIKKIHQWDHSLGKNCPRANADNIVLVIRGELLKKYPNALVFAQKAQYDPADATKSRQLKENADGTAVKFPLFKADIDPDITLFGFDLTAKEAAGIRIEDRNVSTAGKNPGWFFVLKERPGQVNFGLDDLTDGLGNDRMPNAGEKPEDWNDLAWEYFVNTKSDLLQYHLRFDKSISVINNPQQFTWGTNAADVAAILLQDPALLARHAAEMLPEKLPEES